MQINSFDVVLEIECTESELRTIVDFMHDINNHSLLLVSYAIQYSDTTIYKLKLTLYSEIQYFNFLRKFHAN